MEMVKKAFRPDYDCYEGVRPINIYLLRLFFILIAVAVGSSAWKSILSHEGEWNIVEAAAFSMWATYSILSILGLISPLKWLPLMVFIILYKIVWLAAVAYPLWLSGQLAGSTAEEMANEFFVGAIVLAMAVPWGYTFKKYIFHF